MNPRASVVYLLCLSLIVMTPSISRAQWLPGGTEICQSYGHTGLTEIVASGNGGAVISWLDGRNGIQEVFVQKVDERGNTLWARDGVRLFESVNNMYNQVPVSDGSGGVFIVCSTETLGPYGQDIYLNRIDAGGNDAWGIGGYFMTYTVGNQQFPDICTDGSGGAYIVWQDHRGSSWDIYAHHISGDGTIDWPGDGRVVCLGSGDQMFCSIAYDGQGCAVVTWRDTRADDGDIYAQKFDVDGNMLWPSNGIAVCNSPYQQDGASIVSDEDGNTIIAWRDYRNNSDYNLYAQKYDAIGNFQWAPGGELICDNVAEQYNISMTPDGAGGAIIAWEDYRAGTSDIYAARVTSDGHVVWTEDGQPICDAANDQYMLKLESDGDEGAIASWIDFRAITGQLYIQRIDRSGNSLWGSNGMWIGCSAETSYPSLAADGRGGVIVAFTDWRSEVYIGVYAERWTFDGDWGIPEPEIEAVIDVPHDEGGYVNISWLASDHDRTTEVTHYTVWRAISQPQALLALDSGARMIESAGELGQDIDDRVIREELRGSSTFFWEYLYWIDAAHIDRYSETVWTSFDSVGTSTQYHYFQVIAQTSSELVFWVSEPDSGYSVDNLSPAMPLGLAGTQAYEPSGMQLVWEPNSEKDLAGYNIYRGTESGFTPGPGNFMTSTQDPEAFDGGWTWEPCYWYKVAAVDIHGNESPYAVFGPDMITGDDPMPTPDADFLAQNYPNPFNPSTMIAFGLRTGGHVSLKIFDASGRLVTTLVNESRPAGKWTVDWNGKDSNGNTLSSGVYFYKLVAGEFIRTRKMVLLR